MAMYVRELNRFNAAKSSALSTNFLLRQREAHLQRFERIGSDFGQGSQRTIVLSRFAEVAAYMV